MNRVDTERRIKYKPAREACVPSAQRTGLSDDDVKELSARVGVRQGGDKDGAVALDKDRVAVAQEAVREGARALLGSERRVSKLSGTAGDLVDGVCFGDEVPVVVKACAQREGEVKRRVLRLDLRPCLLNIVADTLNGGARRGLGDVGPGLDCGSVDRASRKRTVAGKDLHGCLFKARQRHERERK